MALLEEVGQTKKSLTELEAEEILNQGKLLTMADDLVELDKGQPLKINLKRKTEKKRKEAEAKEKAEIQKIAKEAEKKLKEQEILNKQKQEENIKQQQIEVEKKEKEQTGQEGLPATKSFDDVKLVEARRKLEEAKARAEAESKKKIEEVEKREKERQDRIVEEQKRREEERIRQIEEQKKRQAEQQKQIEIAKRAQEEKERLKEEQKEKVEEELQQKQEAEKRRLQEELRKKQEEERLKISEEQKKILEAQKEAQEMANLEKEKEEIELKIREFPKRRHPLELRVQKILAEKEALQKILQANALKEKKVEGEVLALEQRETGVNNTDERQKLEKQRWLIEKSRREVEKAKWDLEEQEKQKEHQLVLARKELIDLTEEQTIIEKKREEAERKLKVIQEKREKRFLTNQVLRLKEQASEIAKEQAETQGRVNQIQQKISASLEKEEALDQKKEEVEEKEREAKNKEEEKKFEQERWDVERNRRALERERWVWEMDQKKINVELEIIQNKYRDLSLQISQTEKRLDEIGKAEPKVAGDAIKPEQTKPVLAAPIVSKPAEKAKPGGLSFQPARPENKIPEKIATAVSPPAPKFEAIKKPAEIARKPLPIGGGVDFKTETTKAPSSLKFQNQAEIEQIAKTIRERAINEEQKEKLRHIRESAEFAKGVTSGVHLRGPLSKEEILKKMTSISPQEEQRRDEFMAKVEGKNDFEFQAQKQDGQGEVIFRPIIKQPGFWEKLMVRFMMVILFAGLALAIYLLLRIYVFGGKVFELP